MSGNFLSNITAHDFPLFCERMLTEKMLREKRDGQCLVWTIRSREIPRWHVKSAMFALHKTPTVVGIGSERPPIEIGLHGTAAVETREGVAVVFAEVEKAVDAAVNGGCQFVGDDVPLVVTLNEEKTTFVVGVGLRLVEMAVFSDVFFHIAMGVDAVVALQFRGESRRSVGQAKVVVDSATGTDFRISEQGFHRVDFDGSVADEGDSRNVLRSLKSVFQFQTVGQRVRQAEFRAEEPEIVLRVGLSIVATACAEPSHIVERSESAFQLRKQVEIGRVQVVDGLGIAVIFVVAVALGELKSARKREGLETVFVDGFAPK